jgi:hypothetical protein
MRRLTFRCKHRRKRYFFFRWLLTLLANRDPSGITCGYATLDFPLQASSKAVLLFEKEVPLFTKQYFQHLLNN